MFETHSAVLKTLRRLPSKKNMSKIKKFAFIWWSIQKKTGQKTIHLAFVYWAQSGHFSHFKFFLWIFVTMSYTVYKINTESF